MPAKPSTLHKVAFAVTTIAGGLIASRYLSSRKVSASERLAEALLDTDRLGDAARHLPSESEAALADCAGWLMNFALHAAEGVGIASGQNDPVGHSRTHVHPYTHAVATVLTDANVPEHVLTYTLKMPDVGEAHGTRRVGALHLNGLSPARATPDTLQIGLADGYNAQMETEFHTTDALVTGRSRLFGTATMRDNRGNVGRLHIGEDGTLSGTITREARIVGRFEGKIASGLHFKPYQIEGA